MGFRQKLFEGTTQREHFLCLASRSHDARILSPTPPHPPNGSSSTFDRASLSRAKPYLVPPSSLIPCHPRPLAPPPPRFFQPQKDTVIACPLGHYSTGLAQACTPCGSGYRCPNPDSDESLPCLSGTFAVGGKHVCTDCPAGFTCRYEPHYTALPTIKLSSEPSQYGTLPCRRSYIKGLMVAPISFRSRNPSKTLLSPYTCVPRLIGPHIDTES